MTKFRPWLFLALVALAFVGVFLSFKRNSVFGQECFILESQQKLACVRSELEKRLAAGQVNQALADLAEYKDADSQFSGLDCHALAHYIGDRATQTDPDLDGLEFNHGALCQYGFYHAFMAFFVRQNNTSEAVNFCERVGDQLGGGAADACYHGLGHGAVYVFNEDLGLTDTAAIIDEGVSLCSQTFGDDEHQIYWCLTGVYNGLPEVVNDIPEKGEIHGLCSRQDPARQSVCYEYLSMWLADWSLITTIPTRHQAAAVRGIMTTKMHQPPGLNQEQGETVCRQLEPQLVSPCLESVTKALAEYL